MKSKPTLKKRILGYFILFSLFNAAGFAIVSQIFLSNYEKTLRINALNNSNFAKQSMEFLLNMTQNTSSLLASSPSVMHTLQQPVSPTEFAAGATSSPSTNPTAPAHRIDPFFPSNTAPQQKNDPLKPEQTDQDIDLMLRNIVSVNDHIDNIYIIGNNNAIGNNGKFFSGYWNSDKDEIQSRFSEIIKMHKNRKKYKAGEKINQYIPFLNMNIIAFIQPIFQYPEGIQLGIIIIELNYTSLREIFTFSSLKQSDEKVLVINKAREALFASPFNTLLDSVINDFPALMENNQALEGKVFGKNSFIISSDISQSDWKIIRVISKDYIYETMNKLIQIGLIIWILLILASFIASFLISISITKPFIRLNETIREVKKGNLKAQALIEGPEEISQIATSFNRMVQRISELMNEVVEEQKIRSEIEFQMLQSQINPHFLYNTLDSIKWLAVIQNVENISDMVTSLINLLKYNISKTSKLVTLSEEIEYIKDYIEVQKFRFGDAFDIVYNLDESTKNKYILKSILQPIVENAIFHGFDDIDYQGVITITSLIHKNRLEISISDNGRGLKEILSSENEPSCARKKKMHSRIGINNVADRLSLYFSERAAINIGNSPQGGVSVLISIPRYDKPISLESKHSLSN